MTNFPYIKWWQTSVHIVIEFLHKSENPIAEKKDNILIFKDNKYNLELDLLNDFKIEGILTNPKTTKLYLLKSEEYLQWNKLLKNEAKYKYYISTDWDKFLEDELEDENNMNDMMQEFDPSMLNTEQLNNLMKNMNTDELVVPDFSEDNEILSDDAILDEETPPNVETFDIEENNKDENNKDENIENSISNLDK